MRLHEWYVDQQWARAAGDAQAKARGIRLFQYAMLAAAVLSLSSSAVRLAGGTPLTPLRGVSIAFWVFVAYGVVRQRQHLQRRLRESEPGLGA